MIVIPVVLIHVMTHVHQHAQTRVQAHPLVHHPVHIVRQRVREIVRVHALVLLQVPHLARAVKALVNMDVLYRVQMIVLVLVPEGALVIAQELV